MAKYTRGKLAVLQTALVSATTPDVMPKPADRRNLCETNQIKLGFGSKSITFENFCTGGSDVEIPTGKTPRLDVGDAQWTDDSVALQDLEKAGREDVEVWYWYYPKGIAAGKGYFGKLNVAEWDMTSESAGLTTVAHQLKPIGMPTPFGFPHLKDNVDATTVNPTA